MCPTKRSNGRPLLLRAFSYILSLLVCVFICQSLLLTSHEGIDGVKRTSPRRNSSTKDLPFLYLLA